MPTIYSYLKNFDMLKVFYVSGKSSLKASRLYFQRFLERNQPARATFSNVEKIFRNTAEQLADDGYDVWLGNYRGNTYSRELKIIPTRIINFGISDKFYQYDYGPTKSLKNYGSKYTPPYKLNNVRVTIIIFHADNDLLAVPKDVENLFLQLPNVVKVIKVDNKYFNHADFLISTHVTDLVNNPIKDILEEAENLIDEYISKSSGGGQNIQVQ